MELTDPMKTFLIVTSISAPNAAMAAHAAGCAANGWRYVVVGDEKSPSGFALDGCDFLSLERQRESGFRLAASLPVRSYSRKILGYLLAMRGGADAIVETDDDNLPYDTFWSARSRTVDASAATSKGRWVNVYSHFTKERIWPRGLPLDEIASPIELAPSAAADCPIQQGLADTDPDVDAVYRLVLGQEVRFDRSAPPVVIRDAWCPFNSQNTTWFPDAWPLMYLPSKCTFRMTDIWRSFVAQRVARANGWGVLFHAPTLWQERNEHDFTLDFADEVPGYLHNAAIARELDALHLSGGVANIESDMRRCYDVFIKSGHIGEDETALLDDWFEDLREAVR